MDLLASYKAAIYEVKIEELNYSLRFGEINSDFVSKAMSQFNIENFGIITAYNPKSIQIDDAENHKKNILLGKKLRQLKVDYFYGKNIDPLSKWPVEISFFIWPCTKELLSELCLEFNQNAAVLGNKKGELELILNSP